MVTIKDLNIEIEGFKILPVDDYFHLTTAKSEYESTPNDGGINLAFAVSIDGIPNGHFYIMQVANNHTLEIITENQDIIKFDSMGEVLKDSVSEFLGHIKYFPIRENIIHSNRNKENKIVFFDAPFRHLKNQYRRIEYKIEFETWFQYSETMEPHNNFKPILKFNWDLYSIAEKINEQWLIIESKFSSKDSIEKSIRHFNPTDEPISPNNLRNLTLTVKKEVDSLLAKLGI